MKRILVLALVLIVAISSLAVPSYAAEITNTFFDVLSFTTPDNSGSLTVSVTSEKNYFYFDLPFYTSLYNLDIVLRSDIPNLRVYGDGNQELHVSLIDSSSGYLYRVYGSLNGFNLQRFYLNFFGDYSGTGTVVFQSVFLSTLPITDRQITVSGYLTAAGDWLDFTYTAGFQGPHLSIDISSSDLYYDFSAGFNLSQWRLYDYIDVSCTFQGVAAITSIVACFVDENGDDSGTYIPVEHSFVGSSFYGDGEYQIIIRVDLRDIVRSSSDQLILNVYGEHRGSYIDLYVDEVTGGIASSYPDPVIILLRSLQSTIIDFSSSVGGWFYSLYNAVTSGFSNMVDGFNRLAELLGGSGDTQGFEDEVGQQGDKLDDMQQVMDSVQKPDLGSINTDLSGIVSPADTANVAQVYTMVIGDSFMPQIMTMVVIMAMMSFVLFGKR